MTRIKLLAAFVCCFLMAGTALAQAEGDALPGDGPLYQAKLETESARLNAATDPLDKASRYTEQASERMAELEALSANSDHGHTADLVAQYEEAIDNAETQISHAQAMGNDASDAMAAVDQTTARHTEVLTALLEQVPEQAHDAILHAREVSSVDVTWRAKIAIALTSNAMPAEIPAEETPASRTEVHPAAERSN